MNDKVKKVIMAVSWGLVVIGTIGCAFSNPTANPAVPLKAVEIGNLIALAIASIFTLIPSKK